MLKDGETTEFENRTYVDPNVALNESLGFIDNLKAVQAQNNQQIKDQTYNLGTAVPSQMGGLLGADSYFTSRYQTPQTVALVNDLRATAQAQALNDALKSEQSKWRNRYNVAYRNARRRAKNNGGGGGGGGNDGNSSNWDGEFEDIVSEGEVYVPTLRSAGDGTTVIYNGSKWIDSNGNGGYGYDVYDDQMNLIGRNNKVVYPQGNNNTAYNPNAFPTWDEIGRIGGGR